MRKFKVCKDGEPFEARIDGTFDNPEQEIEVTRVLTGELMAVEFGRAVTKTMIDTMAVVTIAKPDNVRWTDKYGSTHNLMLLEGQKYFINKKFLV